VLKRMFVPQRDKVTGGWRIFPTAGPHTFYYSPYIVWLMNEDVVVAGRVVRMGEVRDAGGEALGWPRLGW
jgi:hypothetical protein